MIEETSSFIQDRILQRQFNFIQDRILQRQFNFIQDRILQCQNSVYTQDTAREKNTKSAILPFMYLCERILCAFVKELNELLGSDLSLIYPFLIKSLNAMYGLR